MIHPQVLVTNSLIQIIKKELGLIMMKMEIL